MKARKIDKFLFWFWIVFVMFVLIILFLAFAKPVGAASVCGPLVGNADLVEHTLTTAQIPHQVFVDAQSYPSCLAIGCPKPRTVCKGWRIRLNATAARWVDLAFNMRGGFVGVR